MEISEDLTRKGTTRLEGEVGGGVCADTPVSAPQGASLSWLLHLQPLLILHWLSLAQRGFQAPATIQVTQFSCLLSSDTHKLSQSLHCISLGPDRQPWYHQLWSEA